MPIWLQLVTAVSAGGVSALLGIALVPYLKKLRYFPPQEPKPDAAQESEGEFPKTEHPEAVQEEQRPIMGGLLTAAGILFALVLGGTLFLQFGGADRTGMMCLLMEGLLGVSESDLLKDYELTTFSIYGHRHRDGHDMSHGLPMVKAFPGATLQEKINNLFLDEGVTQAEIDEFKQLML